MFLNVHELVDASETSDTTYNNKNTMKTKFGKEERFKNLSSSLHQEGCKDRNARGLGHSQNKGPLSKPQPGLGSYFENDLLPGHLPGIECDHSLLFSE